MPPSRREDVALLSERLHEALLADQKRERAPRGKDKCPLCGAILEPTKNGRVRTHEADPYEGERCPASARPWKEFNDSKRAPRRAR